MNADANVRLGVEGSTTEQSEEGGCDIMHKMTQVPRYIFQIASGFLALLFIAVASTIVLTLVWLAILTAFVGHGNDQQKKAAQEANTFREEIRERLDKLEKSNERIEESTAPLNPT